MGGALLALTAQRPETQFPMAMILALTARKPQQNHLPNARGKGRAGNIPFHQAPLNVTLVGKSTIDTTVHPPPPPLPPPLRPPLAHPAPLVATTHAKESTSATTTEAGDTYW